MFEDKLNWAMCSRGLNVEAFESLLRDEEYLSDNKFFSISRFINTINPQIFLTKRIGDLEIICRRFDIAVTYTIKTTNECGIDVDFSDLSLKVKYVDCELIIDQNLLDYRGEHNKLFDLRQIFLNEIMIRYFAKILFLIYRQLRWFE